MKIIPVLFILVTSLIAQSKPVTKPPVSVPAQADFSKGIETDALDLKLLKAHLAFDRAQNALQQNTLAWFNAQRTADEAKAKAETAAPELQKAAEEAAKTFQSLVDEKYKLAGKTKDKFDFDTDKMDFVEKKVTAPAPPEKK